MKIELKGRTIPRKPNGDPGFRTLEGDVLNVFTPNEVVELVNRALYQMEYQRSAHKERGQRVRDAERALRDKVKQMYRVSWLKATPEQIAEARKALEKGEE